MYSVLALLRESVNFFKAWQWCFPNSSLLQLSVRYYTVWHARVLTISDKDK
jgi:hypothetical protein